MVGFPKIETAVTATDCDARLVDVPNIEDAAFDGVFDGGEPKILPDLACVLLSVDGLHIFNPSRRLSVNDASDFGLVNSRGCEVGAVADFENFEFGSANAFAKENDDVNLVSLFVVVVIDGDPKILAAVVGVDVEDTVEDFDD